MTDIKIEIKNINEEEMEEGTADELPTSDAEGGEKPCSNVQLPLNIKKRIRALNKLQEEVTKNEIDLHKTVYELDIGYNDRNEELEEKRRAIVKGEYEPTEEDLDIYPHNPKDFVTVGAENKEWGVLITDSDYITYYPKYDESTKGIPNFWLRVFKHSKLSDFVEEHDEPLLSHLQDIKTKYNSGPHEFNLEFYFSENEYFTNKILTKGYHVKYEPQTKPYFKFEGPEIYMSEGCKINWKEGKDITYITEIKKQRHKRSQKIRLWKKKVQRDSFFNYFKYSFYKDTEERISYEMEIMRESDFEFGAYFKEKVIPKAYIYFTGELYENDSTSETIDDGTDSSVATANDTDSSAATTNDTDSSAATTNDCKDFLAATIIDTDSPSATTNETDSPAAIIAGDKGKPAEITTGVEENPSGDKESQSSTTGDKVSPIITAGDKESPATTTGDKEIPITTADDKEIPAATAGDKESPTATTGDEESSTTIASDEENSAATTGDEESSTTIASDEESSTTIASDEENSAETTGDEESSTTIASDEENSAETTGDEESPIIIVSDEENSAATTGEEESSTTIVSDEENSAATAGDEENPIIIASDEENSAATAGDKESPTATAGDREIASTTTGDEESPAPTADDDKENHAETITVGKSGSAAAIDSDREPHFNY